MKPASNNEVGETGSFQTEGHYAKQPDGFVYYYWRIVGSNNWNLQKTAMKEVPTIEMTAPTPVNSLYEADKEPNHET